jgi:hypothetical protein
LAELLRKDGKCIYCGHSSDSSCYGFVNGKPESLPRHQARCRTLTQCALTEQCRHRDFEFGQGLYRRRGR